MVEFDKTERGKEFFDKQLPALINSIGHLATMIDRLQLQLNMR